LTIDESSAVTQVPALRTNSSANTVALCLEAPHGTNTLVDFAAGESEGRPSDCDFVGVGVVVGAGRQPCDTESVKKSLLLEQIVPAARSFAVSQVYDTTGLHVHNQRRGTLTTQP